MPLRGYSTTEVGMTERLYMSFLKNLFGGTPAKPEKHFYTFNVKCKRCGEIIEGRVDLDNDLSLNDEGRSEERRVGKECRL